MTVENGIVTGIYCGYEYTEPIYNEQGELIKPAEKIIPANSVDLPTNHQVKVGDNINMYNADYTRKTGDELLSTMTAEEKAKIEERIVEVLKTVHDPEIPVDIYNLGLIYRVELQDNGQLEVDMTLTAPNCPAADFIVEDVRLKLDGIEGVTEAKINLVFEPEWDKDMMSEEAKLELGFL